MSRLYSLEISDKKDLNSLQVIMHKIASEYVKMYLQYDANEFQSFRIIELENDKDYEISFPVEILGKQETIQIYGIIDRVDQVVTDLGEIKTRIVDYKTGSDAVKFSSIDKVLSANTENKALVQTLFYSYVYEQKTGLNNLEPNLYVARKMREEGTLFYGSRGVLLQGETLNQVKIDFVNFLRDTIQEIFNPEVPFKHNPDSQIYESDPYTLFYRNALKADEEMEE